MANKVIIENKPFAGNLSQYNYENDANNLDYENSTGLPKNYDKFTKKDLYTTVVGDELNEKIIERNLKFSGESFVKINKLKIDNAGVRSKIKNWIWIICLTNFFYFS